MWAFFCKPQTQNHRATAQVLCNERAEGKENSCQEVPQGFFPPKSLSCFFLFKLWYCQTVSELQVMAQKIGKKTSFKQVSWLMSHNAQIYLDINKQLMKSWTVNSKLLQILRQQCIKAPTNKKSKPFKKSTILVYQDPELTHHTSHSLNIRQVFKKPNIQSFINTELQFKPHVF